MSEYFVNPYTFVPLVGHVHRAPPPDHLPTAAQVSLPARYSGSIDVTWTLKTPFLLPDEAVVTAEGWITQDGRVRIPGSSLKGAVRSTHEALFNGCLRVIDRDFVPGYRAAATAEAGWTLAVVVSHPDRADTGMPHTFQLCDQSSIAWLDSRDLIDKWPKTGPLPTTGDVVRTEGSIRKSDLQRDEYVELSSIAITRRSDDGHTGLLEEGDEVFLVTDVGARKPSKRDGSPGRCLFAFGMLTATTATLDVGTPAGEAVWARFQRAHAGADDRRRLEKPPPNEPPPPNWRGQRAFKKVVWNARPVGRRALHTGFLFPRDVVWVKIDGGQITDIKLSQIWRKAGRGPVAQRIVGFEPCGSPPATSATNLPDQRPDQRPVPLCLSCATFGGADILGDVRGDGRQDSYAGHVNFSAAMSDAKVDTIAVELTPMSTPRPGTGMFYLELPSTVRSDRPPGDKPGQWGATLDRGGDARIRGRKFFWHADPDEQAAFWTNQNRRAVPRRYEATSRQREGRMTRAARLIPAGTVLVAKVTVDALPRPHVIALLAALAPQRLRAYASPPVGTIGVHLGGGKPLGLGSATVEVVPHLMPTRTRYTEAATDDDGGWSAAPTKADLEEIERYVGPDVRRAVSTTLRVLDLDALGDDERLVAYPPGADWSDFGTQPFRESFGFFVHASGEQLKGGSRDWLPLPQPTAGDLKLPSVRKRRRGR